MTTQPDNALNHHTIEAKGAEDSIWYFGCWLDINQTTNQIPPWPLNDGPYPGNSPIDFSRRL